MVSGMEGGRMTDKGSPGKLSGTVHVSLCDSGSSGTPN